MNGNVPNQGHHLQPESWGQDTNMPCLLMCCTEGTWRHIAGTYLHARGRAHAVLWQCLCLTVPLWSRRSMLRKHTDTFKSKGASYPRFIPELVRKHLTHTHRRESAKAQAAKPSQQGAGLVGEGFSAPFLQLLWEAELFQKQSYKNTPQKCAVTGPLHRVGGLGSSCVTGEGTCRDSPIRASARLRHPPPAPCLMLHTVLMWLKHDRMATPSNALAWEWENTRLHDVRTTRAPFQKRRRCGVRQIHTEYSETAKDRRSA